jgi:hypothetical protein
MSREGRGRRASAKAARVEEQIHSAAPEALRELLAEEALNEDLALALLRRRDLPGAVLEELSGHRVVRQSRRVLLGVVGHPRTPRHVSLPVARHLYTFELMQLALTMGIAPDVRRMVEDLLVSRLETLAAGERLTLARRGSGRVAAALLLDAETRVMQAALVNPYVTEAAIVKALANDDAPAALVEAVCRHEKWSRQRDVRLALLRKEATPLARAITFAESLPTNALRDVLHYSQLPAAVKAYLLGQLERRKRKQPVHPRRSPDGSLPGALGGK